MKTATGCERSVFGAESTTNDGSTMVIPRKCGVQNLIRNATLLGLAMCGYKGTTDIPMRTVTDAFKNTLLLWPNT